MLLTAVKQYLHSTTIKQQELLLIKSCIKESEYKLKDFLPENKGKSTNFLCTLLRISLNDYKNNVDFVNDIISLTDKDNARYFYNTLQENQHGLKIIQKNPGIFYDNKNKVFRDLLVSSSNKVILDFVKENKDTINIETLYTIRRNSLNLIVALEKEGFEFDERIVPCLHAQSNFSNPHKLISYLEKFKEKTDSVTWDTTILSILDYYNEQIGRRESKNIFKDAFFLLTKLKEPSKFRWDSDKIWDTTDKEVHINNDFNFGNSLRFYLKPQDLTDRYIWQQNVNNFDELRNFIKNNDIYFHKLDYATFILTTFVDDFNPLIVEDVIKSSFPQMFNFKLAEEEQKQGTWRKRPIFEKIDNDIPLFKNEKIRLLVLKEYFANSQCRFEYSHHEDNFFQVMGISEQSLRKDKALDKYFDTLPLDAVNYIAKKFNFDVAEWEKKYLEYSLPVNNTVKEKKIKI